MSIWYRAASSSDPTKTFSGDGGLYVDGRWHHKGRRVVYCSQSISLAMLEWRTHNGLSVDGFTFHKFRVEISDDQITYFETKNLPRGWESVPATFVTKNFSDKTLFSPSGPLAIAVPSAIIHEEFNLIINPLHSAFPMLKNSITYLGKTNVPKR